MRKSRLESETDSNNKDSEKLKNQIKDLKRAVESLQKDLGDKDSEIDILQERLACEKMDLQKLHNSELESERTVYSAKMHELEKQMHNQRTRTMSLINEKDCEIERLKQKVAKEHPGSPSVHRKNAAMLSRNPSSSDEAVNELLLQSSPVRIVVYFICKYTVNLHTRCTMTFYVRKYISLEKLTFLTFLHSIVHKVWPIFYK